MQTLDKQDATLTIRVPRELDHHCAEQLRWMADEQIEKGQVRNLIFDFSDTEFCDSSGIGMLMGRYKMMRSLGGIVSAVQVKERVYRILMLSGIHKIIRIERG